MKWADLPDVLTTEEVERALGIGEKSARKIMAENGGIKIAGKWLIAKTKLKAIFE